MNFGNVSTDSLVPWVLDSTKSPCDEGQFLQAMVYLRDHPEWIKRDDAATYCKLLVETRTSNTAVGMQARTIQNILFQQHSSLFDLVTCKVGALQIEPQAIPKGRLEAMSELFKRGLAAGMQERRLGTWDLIPEEGVSKEEYAQFLQFLGTEGVEITEQNIFSLLRLAESNRVPLLGAACAKFIVEKLDFEDIQDFAALVEFVSGCSGEMECIRDLKWHFVCYAAEHLDEPKLTALLEHIEECERDGAEAFLRLGMQCRAFDIQLACKIENPRQGNRRAILKTDLRAVTLSSDKSLTESALTHLQQMNKEFGITGLLVAKGLTDEQLAAISASCGSNLLELHCPEYSQITSFLNCSFPNLVGITIRSCNLTNEGLARLTCHSLKELHLDGCSSISVIPVALLGQLVKLGATATALTNEELQRLGAICGTLLQELRLGYCKQIKSLEGFQFSKLKKLELCSTEISNTDLCFVSDICGDYLEELDIIECGKISSLKNCRLSKLIKLQIGGHLNRSSIDDDDLLYLSGICSDTLKELDISQCKKITTLKGFKLVVLKADYSGLTNEGLLDLRESSGDSLEVLDITSCSINSFKEISFTRLRQLICIFCSDVTNEEMQALSVSLRDTLEELNITHSSRVTLEGCPLVKLIKLEAKSSGITNKALQELCHNSKNLKELRISPKVSLEDCHFSDQTVIIQEY